jgi:hypothetical protein
MMSEVAAYVHRLKMMYTKEKSKDEIFVIFAVTVLSGYIVLNLSLEYFNVADGPRLTDFDTYYYSARRILQDRSLYAEAVAPNGSSRKFVYPPVAIVLFVPFSFLPFTISGILWNILSLMILLFGVSQLFSELIHESQYDTNKINHMVVLLSIVGFAPTINWLKNGQASGVVVGGLCLFVAYLLRSKRVSGGEPDIYDIFASILTPAICFIKPYYAPSGAHLLQNTRRLIISAISGCIILVISILMFGVETHMIYIETILLGEGSNLTFTTPPSQWNASIYSPLYIFGHSAHIVRAIIIPTTVVTILILNYHTKNKFEIVLLGMLLIPIATPTRVDGLSALIPVFLIMLIRYWEVTRLRTLTIISVLLIHIHPYTIELLAKIGPQYIPILDEVAIAVPLLQPALWGHILISVIVFYTIVR